MISSKSFTATDRNTTSHQNDRATRSQQHGVLAILNDRKLRGYFVTLDNSNLRQRARSESKLKSNRIDNARRRAKRVGASKCEPIDPLDVFERFDWKCALCGVTTPRELLGTSSPRKPTLDHIIALCLGGDHTRANVQLLCSRCNTKKGVQEKIDLKCLMRAGAIIRVRGKYVRVAHMSTDNSHGRAHPSTAR